MARMPKPNALLAGALVALAFDASAQTIDCAKGGEPCAQLVAPACLQSLGAGARPVAPAAGCADQIAAYQKCLFKVVEKCGGDAQGTPSAPDPRAVVAAEQGRLRAKYGFGLTHGTWISAKAKTVTELRTNLKNYSTDGLSKLRVLFWAAGARALKDALIDRRFRFLADGASRDLVATAKTLIASDTYFLCVSYAFDGARHVQLFPLDGSDIAFVDDSDVLFVTQAGPMIRRSNVSDDICDRFLSGAEPGAD